MSDLSVLIPARNEMFLQNTIDDVLKNIRGDTEIIVVLDGYESKAHPGGTWPDYGMPMHERVTVVHRPVSIGQRGATNEAARLSTSKYIMKLDAHCAVAQGFDVQLMEDAQRLPENVMQVPAQYNLHVFDWVCKCGWSRYQSPPPKCEKCGAADLTRKMIWKPRKSRLATAWRFDKELHFQYWGAYKHKDITVRQGDITDTMSLLGACWFVSRERFWEIDGLDEKHGSWGQMGTELACKTWLSGGRLVCNHKTWFAHLFRTGGMGFPYLLKQSDVDRARKYSQDLWRNDKWPKATRKLSWLIDYFAPVPGWESGAEEPAVETGPAPSASRAAAPAPVPTGLTKGVVYYSDCRGDGLILQAARSQLARATNGHRITSVTLAPVDFGDIRVVMTRLERGHLTMFQQILAGLELSDADIIFLAEHDVLYDSSHFDFTPPSDELVYYNENVWKVDQETGRALHYACRQTSGLCAYRSVLLEHYRKRVELVKEHGFSRKMGFEPGTHGRPERVDLLHSEAWMSPKPNIDIRHKHNLTPSRWRKDQFRDKRHCQGWTEADEVPGWGRTKGRFAEFLTEVA